MHLPRLPMVVLLSVLLAAAALAEERILDFHSDVIIQPDASLLVHEVIRVNSEGLRIRHGIFRTFPTHYVSHTGGSYDVEFQLQTVLRDGAPEQSEEDRAQNGVIIKLGRADTVLPPGEYTYELTYTVTRELGFFDDHDELFWNVTGLDWIFPIDHASATVALPGPVQSADLKLTGYTGPRKSRAQHLTFRAIDPSTVTFETTSPLGSHEGLTIVVGFPRGMVAEPTPAERRRALIEQNAAGIAGAAGLLVVALYYFVAWLLVGRNPRPGVIVVSYEPPPGLSPPAMRYLERMGYDDRVLASAVVDLAVKRHLTIQQEGRTYTLKQIEKPSGVLAPEERDLLNKLFAFTTEVTVSAGQAGVISLARTALKADLAVEENQTLFRKNRHWIAPGILLTLATIVAVVMSLPAEDAGGVAVLVVFVSVLTAVSVLLLRTGASARKSRAAGAGGLTVASAIFTLLDVGLIAALLHVAGAWIALTLLALLVANIIGIHALPSLTPAGAKLIDQIAGFKQYVMEVDSDRIRRLNPPEKTPALFEKIFPYALALGVEQLWGKQFSGVLAQAAAVGGATTGYSPDWYSSTDWDTFDVGRFSESFSSDFSSAVSSATTTVSSSDSSPGSDSGFSDSGSSGDGGGGGGGGGW